MKGEVLIRADMNLVAEMLFPFQVRILRVIPRSDDAEAFHLVDERSAVYTKFRGGSSRPAQFPV
jgi:hypothetical protein